MKRVMLLLALACVLCMTLGCVTPMTTSVWGIIMRTESTYMVGDTTVGQSKVGTAEVEGIILVAFGDASITAACDAAGITRIHHIDTEELNILNIYARKIMKVYGE